MPIALTPLATLLPDILGEPQQDPVEAEVMARCKLAQTMAVMMLSQEAGVTADVRTVAIWVHRVTRAITSKTPVPMPVWAFRIKLWINEREINFVVQLREEEYPGIIARKIYHGTMYHFLNNLTV